MGITNSIFTYPGNNSEENTNVTSTETPKFDDEKYNFLQKDFTEVKKQIFSEIHKIYNSNCCRTIQRAWRAYNFRKGLQISLKARNEGFYQVMNPLKYLDEESPNSPSLKISC